MNAEITGERFLYAVVLPLCVLILSSIPWLVVRTIVTTKVQTLYSKSAYKKIHKQVLKQGILDHLSLRSLWESLTMLPWWRETRSPEVLRRLILYWCYCGVVLVFCVLVTLPALGFLTHRVLLWPYLVFKGAEFIFCVAWFRWNGV